MNSSDVIAKVSEQYSEWLEMVEDPSLFIASVLANKVIKLEDYISYLEKRLKNEKVLL